MMFLSLIPNMYQTLRASNSVHSHLGWKSIAAGSQLEFSKQRKHRAQPRQTNVELM